MYEKQSAEYIIPYLDYVELVKKPVAAETYAIISDTSKIHTLFSVHTSLYIY